MKSEISVDSKVYDDLGGVEEIIASYLDKRVFEGLNEEDKYVAENILDALTGGGGLRAFLTIDEISKQIGRDEEKVEDVLEHLIKKRIVHPPGKEDKLKGYELIHDFLSRRFFERLSPEARKIKTVIDIFRRAFRDWKQYGILASGDRLEMFFEYRNKLSLGYEEYLLIIESALTDGKYVYWLKEIDYKTNDRVLVNILENSQSVKAKRRAAKFCGGGPYFCSYFHKSCDAIPALINNLRDEDSDVRGNAAEALGEIGDERTVVPLIEALKDENSGVRENAAKALNKIGDERAVVPLAEALKDENFFVLRNAAKALNKIGDERAVVPLIEALKNEYSDVRENVTKALGEIGDERAVVPLIEALKGEDSGVRENVAKALGKIGDERAVVPLIKALGDKKFFVRRNVTKSLGEMGGERAVVPLIEALKDEDSGVRGYVAEALGKIGDKRAVEPLMKTLKIEEEDWVKSTIEEALRKLQKQTKD